MSQNQEQIRNCVEWLKSPSAQFLWDEIDELKERNAKQIARICKDTSQAQEVLALVRENSAYDKIIEIRTKTIDRLRLK